MRIFAISELLQLTCDELFALHRKVSTHLLVSPDNAIEHCEALENLANIRRVLDRPVCWPRRPGPAHPAP